MALSDNEKVRIIYAYLQAKKGVSLKDIESKYGIPYTTSRSWLSGTSGNKTRLQDASRSRICTAFGFLPEIWDENTNTEYTYRRKLEMCLHSNKTKEKIKNKLYKPSDDNALTAQESEKLEELKKSTELDRDKLNFEDFSEYFLYQAALIFLKKHSKAKIALQLLHTIESKNTQFKYSYENEIDHLKALCFSHPEIRKWDEAIDLLRRLNVRDAKAEYVTLLASNYKRKALTDTDGQWINKELVDTSLLMMASSYYHFAFTIRLEEQKDYYYDGINYFYIAKILDSLCIESDDDLGAKYDEIHRSLNTYNYNLDNWWEFSSKIEFLMLKGDIAEAKSYLFNYYKEDFSRFELDTTMRQIEMYVHFTQDKNAIEILEILREIQLKNI